MSATNATRLLLDGAPDAGVREQLGERDDAVALGRELGDDALLDARRAPAREPAKCRRLERFERTRSWRVYVARTPRFSSAEATWLILAAKRVFVRCTAGCTLPNVTDPARASQSARSSSTATRRCGVRRCVRRSETRRVTACTGSTSSRAAGFELRHDLEPEFEPGAGARVAAGRARSRRAARGWLLGRLRSCSRVARRAQSFRRRVLDRRHGRDPARAARAPRSREAAGRVRARSAFRSASTQLRGRAARRLFADAFRRLHTIVAYGWGEVEELRAWLGSDGPRVEFVAFGVDTEHFRPERGRAARRTTSSRSARIRGGTSSSLSSSRGACPSVRFASSRRPTTLRRSARCRRTSTSRSTSRSRAFANALLRARVVALPVRENTYSGATTTLLQAMACGKPVVVTRTAAIARGYHLEDGVNCRLVPPGDLGALEHAVRRRSRRPRAGRRVSGSGRGRRSSAI